MSIDTLIIDQGSVTVTVPLGAAHALPQDYEPIEAATLHRLADGSALKQTRWTKWRTTVNGRGATPAAFGRLDFGAAMALHCVTPMALDAVTTTITLPAGRRTDIAPTAAAMVGDAIVPTTLSLVGNVASLGAVAGATGYRVLYYPILTVYATRPRQTGDSRAADYGWELIAEEV